MPLLSTPRAVALAGGTRHVPRGPFPPVSALCNTSQSPCFERAGAPCSVLWGKTAYSIPLLRDPQFPLAHLGFETSHKKVQSALPFFYPVSLLYI